MPPFRIIRDCPYCNGSGSTSDLDYRAMKKARESKGVSVANMASQLKIPIEDIIDMEVGSLPVPTEVEQAYVELLPKKARGGP